MLDRFCYIDVSCDNVAFSYMPSPLVFFSYIISFQGLLAGPICFFNDYIVFVEGKNIPNERPSAVDQVSILFDCFFFVSVHAICRFNV